MSAQHTLDLSDACVIWQGALDQDGYGRVNDGGKWALAHRKAFIDQYGAIPDGLVIDHLCRNRACVNTSHMEPVTNRENVLRGIGVTAINAQKMFCLNGHELSGGNVIAAGENKRSCKICARRRWREYRQRKIQEGTWTRT